MSHSLLNEAKAMQEQLSAWRRALHKIPETGTQLPQTVQFIEEQLKEAAKDKSDPESAESNLLERVRNVYEIISSDAVDNTVKNEILKSVIEKIVYDRESDELKVYYYYKPQPQ